MSHFLRLSSVFISAAISMATSFVFAQGGPYKITNTGQLMGSGGIDYVFADSIGRRAYVPRGAQVLVFDLDTLRSVGAVAETGGHGVAVDSKTHHGFSSSRPVSMFDTEKLTKIKSIDVQGRPDGIFFEPLTERVYVFSHSAPNATVIDSKDGSIVGTIDLGGAPEQAQSDGQGHLYVDIEDKDQVAVVDVKTLKVTARYGLDGKGGVAAGLGLDAKNHILFVMCRKPQNCVILNADNGKILAALPIGRGTDGGEFNPDTMEAFSSQGDGTLTIIKENSPTSFEVEQTVQTRQGGKTCSLDKKTGKIIVIATERGGAATPPAAGNPSAGGRRGGRGNSGPSMLDIIAVGK